MRGATVKGGNTLSLIHIKGGTKQRGIVEVLRVSIATLAVQLLAYIITAIELTAILQRGNSQLLYLLHRQVQVFPVMSVVSMAVILHLIGLVVVATRVIHHHDKCAVQFVAHHFLIERLRCILLGRSQCLAVLVAESIGELLDGLTQCDDQHVVHLAQHLRLTLLNILGLLSFSHHLTQLQTKLTQL